MKREVLYWSKSYVVWTKWSGHKITTIISLTQLASIIIKSTLKKDNYVDFLNLLYTFLYVYIPYE